MYTFGIISHHQWNVHVSDTKKEKKKRTTFVIFLFSLDFVSFSMSLFSLFQQKPFFLLKERLGERFNIATKGKSKNRHLFVVNGTWFLCECKKFVKNTLRKDHKIASLDNSYLQNIKYHLHVGFDSREIRIFSLHVSKPSTMFFF